MATGGSDLLTELCEELLCCDICTEDFDYKTHTPRILPCYHSFCGTCVEQLTKDDSVECPKCRRVAQVSGKFPMDTTRIALLDKRRALQSQEGVSCEGCTEGAKATSRCQDCEEFLCEDCSAAHRKVKLSRNHVLLSVAEAAKNPDKLLMTSEKCQRHSDKKLELFCISCSTVVCAICALTMHKKCENLVELDSVLDDKKKELLSVCEQLDKVELSFQAKAEASEASLEAVQSNLNEAVNTVEGVFGEIISSATQRQAEVIGELRARAKSDGLLLEEQAATFRSLQAATHTAAQYGRTCVSLSLVSQIFSQNPELQKTARELREKARASVKAAPSYKISTEKLGELKGLLKELGRVETVDFPGSVSRTSSYWQVKCSATARPRIKDGMWLCEFGVATQQALQACAGDDRLISDTDHCALTAVIYTEDGRVRAWATYRIRDLFSTDLGPLPPNSEVDFTLGLLLDTATSRLHVIDVRATRVLWSSDIDLSSPVWPVVRVWSDDYNGAGVSVEVQSAGQQVGMTGDVARLLQSLLGRQAQ